MQQERRVDQAMTLLQARLTLAGLALPALFGLLLGACAPPPTPTIAPTRAEATAVPAKPTPAPAAQPSPTSKPAAFDERAVADFYRGKTIRIVVGFAPGGAFDVYSRILAKYLPKYLPGSPTVIVENRPGAGSVLAANAVYNTEPKDGTVIGSFNEFLVLQQLMDAPGIQFDTGRFQWLGSSVSTFSACLARTDVGIRSIQEIMDGKELVVGTTGPGAATHDTPAVLNAALGTRFKLVPGYDGIAKVQLALESKEVDGYCVSFDAVQIVGRHMLEGDSPSARVLVVMGDKTLDHPFLKGVPAAETLAKTEEARTLLRTLHAPSQMSKPFAVAPDVPRDRVEALRKAVADSFADPQFRDEAQRAQQEVSPSNGERVTAIVRQLLSTPPPVVARLKDVLK